MALARKTVALKLRIAYPDEMQEEYLNAALKAELNRLFRDGLGYPQGQVVIELLSIGIVKLP